jgi:outer membrane protein OmpA-like peptidoglycan-associated protein
LVVGFALACLMATNAFAQNDRFSTEQFAPQPSQFTNFFTVASPQVLEAWRFEMSLMAVYADDPLVVRLPDGTRLEGGDIIANQLVGNVMASVGLGGIIDIGVVLPVFLIQEGDNPVVADVTDPVDNNVGIGDLRIVPKINLVNQDTYDDPGGFQLGILADISVPTGDEDNFQGGGFSAEPRLAIGYGVSDWFDAAINVGYLIRDEGRFQNIEAKSHLTLGAGLDFGVGPDRGLRKLVHFVPEVYAEIHFNVDENLDTDDFNEETPVELIGGVKIFPVEDFLIEAGAGMGLVEGYGTPDWRVFAGIGYSPAPDRVKDADGDGILDEDDECPQDPEDFDGFEDEDGCPDEDNDQDGILDVDDECPDVAEDMDGDEDEDGCPEEPGDADQDGILDEDDECPEIPEDMDGFEDEDGCPDEDNDGDGILDVDDGPEDDTGFGECRNDAEDMDGFEDEDGCPDPDNDEDGIPDVDDECPDEAEVFNGVEDEDGCPDEGDIEVKDCEIDLGDSVIEFATGSAEIRSSSYELLGRIASVLNTRDDIDRIRVEGHTDSRGSDSYNQQLSEQRANSVMEHLTSEGGVDAGRLEAVGYGEARPVDTNDTAAGRQNNRRVEFNFIIPGCENE